MAYGISTDGFQMPRLRKASRRKQQFQLTMRMTMILITFLFISCQEQINISTAPNSEKIIVTDTSFIPKDSTTFYFPLKSFHDTSNTVGLDSFLVTWYSRQLFALREPVIYEDKSQNEIYRFTWLRTFHNPIAIRIEKHVDEYVLYWKLSNGAGGYDPGELSIAKQKILDKKTWQEFIRRLNQTDFWKLISKEVNFGKDGSEWILEGKAENKYQVVDRWTPEENSRYYQCCNFLLSLTDLKIKGREKY